MSSIERNAWTEIFESGFGDVVAAGYFVVGVGNVLAIEECLLTDTGRGRRGGNRGTG
jgi:hypothetical protein